MRWRATFPCVGASFLETLGPKPLNASIFPEDSSTPQPQPKDPPSVHIQGFVLGVVLHGVAVFKARLFRLHLGDLIENCVVQEVKADPRKTYRGRLRAHLRASAFQLMHIFVSK